MLPYGTLRDLPSECRRANAVVVTKCPSPMQPIARRIVSNQLQLASYQNLCYSSISYEPITLSSAPLVVVGIANPTPMFEYIKTLQPDAQLLEYSDHHVFSKRDVQRILKAAQQYSCVVTTEKDYMRMKQTILVDELGDKLVVLRMQTDLGEDKELFDRAIMLYVAENNRVKFSKQNKKAVEDNNN
jgi:tetraacyldisaccharide 4'-kinase